MKNEKISLEIATLKKALLKEMPKVVKAKIEAKIEALEKELKSSSKTNIEFAKSLLSGKKKVKNMAKVDFETLINSLSKKPEYSFLKSLTKKQIKDDLGREAKPVGYRFVGRKNFKVPTRADIKAKRGVYYENRSNRTDVNRSVRLAKGGSVSKKAKGGGILSVYEIKYKNANGERESFKTEAYNKAEAMKVGKFFETEPSQFMRGGFKVVSVDEVSDSGFMAKGGSVSKKLEVGVYRVGKPTNVVANLYEQKIVEIFPNGDIATASDYGRSLSDFKGKKYESYPIITLKQLENQYKKFDKGGSVGSYSDWESDIKDEISDTLEIGYGDAEGIVMANEFYMAQSWGKGMSAKETANLIIAKSKMGKGGDIGGME
jgi:hypothetical protein